MNSMFHLDVRCAFLTLAVGFLCSCDSGDGPDGDGGSADAPDGSPADIADVDMLAPADALWTVPADEPWTGSPAALGCAGGDAKVLARPTVPGERYNLVRAIAQDEANIHVALQDLSVPVQDPQIWTFAKSGGQARLLWTGKGEVPLFMVPDETHLYFTTSSTLRRVARSGGEAELLIAGLVGAGQLAVEGNFLYWAEEGVQDEWRGRVAKAPKAGGAVTVLAEGTKTVGVAVSNGELYYLDGGSGSTAPGGIFKTSTGGGMATLIHAGGGGIQLEVTSGHVFALAGNSIVRVDRGTGASDTFAGRSIGGQSLAVDGTHVYWTVEGYWSGKPRLEESGRVLRAPQGGGEVTDIASCLPKPAGIVVDAQHVYWFNALTNEILRLAK
jgi:hypothetical protein